jgi:hypothetical protein
MRAGLVAFGIASCAWCATVVAEPPDEAGPVPDPSLRWELGVSPSFGAVWAQQAHGAFGGHVEAGIVTGRLQLVGEAELFALDPACWQNVPCGPGTEGGDETRVGIDARWSFIQQRALHGVHGRHLRWERLDAWVEVGIGAERIAIADTPTLARPDVGVGLGLGLTNRKHGVGLALHARLELAPAAPALPMDAAIPAVAARNDAMPDPSFVLGVLVSFGG